MGNRNRGRGYSRRFAATDNIAAPRPSTTCNTILSCDCIKHLDGNHTVGEELYCYYHKKLVTIKVAATEYVVACTQCPFTRRRGQAQHTALQDASMHMIRQRHRVNIFYGAKLVHTAGKAQGQLTFESMDEPPF